MGGSKKGTLAKKAARKGLTARELAQKIQSSHTPEYADKYRESRRLNTIITETVKKEILEKTDDGKSFLQQYTQGLLQASLKDPNSRASSMVAQMIGLDEKFLEKADKWLVDAQNKDQDFEVFRLRNQLHNGQKKVFDLDHDKMLIRHGRRWGKTWLLASYICYYSGILRLPSIYIHKSLKAAMEQMWTPLHDFAKAAGIEITKSDRSSASVEFKGGGILLVRGNDDKEAANTIRGGKFALACVDECFFQKGGLKYLYESVLKAALSQYKERKIILSSSPPVSKVRYYEEIRETWPNFTGDLLENNTIPFAHEEYHRDKLIYGNLTSWRREYMGEWLFDEEALIFHPKDQSYTEADMIGVNGVIAGLDLGGVDNTAYVAVAYNTITKQFWLLKEKMWNGAGTEESGLELQRLHTEVTEWAKSHGITKTVFIESDHDNKLATIDFTNKYKLPLEMAVKTDKVLHFQKIDDLLKTGKLLIPKGGQCWEDCEATVWERSKETDQLLPKMDDSVYHPDMMMALTYAMARIMWDLRI